MAFAIGQARAADMPLKAPPLPPAAYSWTGSYLGANLGFGVARDPSSLSFPVIGLPGGGGPEFFSAQPRGVLGGLQAGYNLQLGRWVVGVETDIQASGQSDSHTCLDANCVAGATGLVKQEMPWLGTTRGRIGYAAGPVLSYVTGGAAYGEVRSTININDTGFTGDAGTLTLSSTRMGWTLGTGVEIALAGNWTAKAEYLYVDLGSQSGTATLAPGGTTSVFNTHFQEQIFRGGVNYRFGGTGAFWPQPTNWSGFTIGGNAGYGLARDPNALAVTQAFPGFVGFDERFDLSPRGYLGGGQAGYNWQIARWVLGVETDIQGSIQKDSQTCIGGCDLVNANSVISVEQKLTWFGTTRARLGYAFGPSLIYATGGLGYGTVKDQVKDVTNGFPLVTFDFSHARVGWAAGAGIETKADMFGLLGPNWTLRTEYLYLDLGNVSDSFAYFGVPFTMSGSVHEHIWRTALNYQFGP